MNPLKALQDHGQAVWLDFLSRGFIAHGGLNKLVDEDGVRGVTSNPAIFEQAIGKTDEYDDAIARMLEERDRSAGELFEQLAVEDIRNATDVLRPVFDASRGADGFVSIEVSPYLATDTKATVAEAKRLWHEVDRKNLMIKVPGTLEGLPAIRELLADGINVNITLLFAQAVYERVVEAYLSGLEALAAKGGDIARIASVASFFVSRIDTAVDKLLDEKIARANDPDEKARLNALKGKIAVANAKLAYQRYLRLFAGERWQALQAHGAKPQRLLWASTGTKNKAYSDVLYVDELIGPDTVNTMPVATLDAFRDHGKVRDSLTEDAAGAQRLLGELSRAGISLDGVTDQLVEDGVRLFADAADKLLAAVAKKRIAVLDRQIGKASFALGHQLEKKTAEIAEDWRRHGNIRKLWQHDKSLWTGADEDRWLGWLDLADDKDIAGYGAFAEEIKGEGFNDAVLLGMGGSSLGPEVLAATFGRRTGWPRLRILDSTVPAQIRALESDLDHRQDSLHRIEQVGLDDRAQYPYGLFLQAPRRRRRRGRGGPAFHRHHRSGIAARTTGRGSKTSVASSMAPRASAGAIRCCRRSDWCRRRSPESTSAQLARATRLMLRSCGPDVPPSENPGVALGIALGAAAARGRDKVTLVTSPALSSFGAWAEQLFAESTGKNGKGLIPIDGEPLGRAEVYGDDRLFIALSLDGETAADHEAKLSALEQAGHPVVRIVQNSIGHIGQEFFRFEIATAVAGAVLEINPFNQPDVEASKIKTRELTAAFEQTGKLPPQSPVCRDQIARALYRRSKRRSVAQSRRRRRRRKLAQGAFRPHRRRRLCRRCWPTSRARRKPRRACSSCGSCCATGAMSPPASNSVRDFCIRPGKPTRAAPTAAYFSRSPPTTREDLAIPGHRASFGVVKAAQARGDFDVLVERGRRALRVHLNGDLKSGLAALEAAVERAMA